MNGKEEKVRKGKKESEVINENEEMFAREENKERKKINGMEEMIRREGKIKRQWKERYCSKMENEGRNKN